LLIYTKEEIEGTMGLIEVLKNGELKKIVLWLKMA